MIVPGSGIGALDEKPAAVSITCKIGPGLGGKSKKRRPPPGSLTLSVNNSPSLLMAENEA